MAGFDYSTLQATASRLIDRFSEQAITISRDVPPTINPSDGSVIPGVNSQQSVQAVVTPYSASQVNNATIIAGDLQVFIKHDYSPLISDSFVIDGIAYKAVNIESYKPSATTLAYKVQVRN